MSAEVRAAVPADAGQVAAIFAHYVTTTVTTFEEVPPTAADWRRRLGDLAGQNLPFLVAEAGGSVCGFAYASPWRPKPAYRHTVEDTVYLSPDRTGRGIGSALLGGLLAGCAQAGARQVIAVIADTGSDASAALHRRFGFTQAGHLRGVGRKHGRWIDTVLMQKDLGPSRWGARASGPLERGLIRDYAERPGLSAVPAVLCYSRPAAPDLPASRLTGVCQNGLVTGQLWPDLLAEAWAALAADGDVRLPAGLEVLWVSGAPGHLPSRLPVEDMAIACTGAALLAAAALYAERGGDDGSRGSPTARLDLGHVAAAFRSEAHLRIDDEPPGPGFAPLSRFWRAADGWVRTHGNYPWHREALLRALACADDPESVAAAVAGLGARQTEDLVTEAGGVAAAVRTEEAWRAEPPGQAVAGSGLVEAATIGGAPPRWRPAGPLPAAGIRVLDLTRVVAGPVATRYLAALGADVLRLDPPDRPELPLQALDGLLGKRSALLDFGTADGNARLHELLSGADVLVHGYRPHALDRFGLTPDVLAERHPGLVVVSLSAWGRLGPWGARRGFDSIVQAASGIAMAESADGERPGAMPCQLLDHGTGYLCAAAALQALARQFARGGTQFRELSLARTAHWLLSQPREATSGSAAVPAPADGERPAWLTTLDSAAGPVTTVLPPGRIDDEALAWPCSLARYGGDAPAWRPVSRPGPG